MIHPTGSQYYGISNRLSDWDYIVSIDSFASVKTLAMSYNPDEVVHSNYFHGIKYIYNDTIINLIPLHPTQFVSWYYAGQCMRQIPAIRRKDLRIKTFELFRISIELTIDKFNLKSLDDWSLGRWETDYYEVLRNQINSATCKNKVK